MKMDSSQVKEDAYTHIHFALIGLTQDWKIETSDTQYQWKRFKDLKTKMKKIASFGGWSFSAEAPNYDVFRSGMRPENRETLATNIADFVTQNILDGVDIDWYVFQRTRNAILKLTPLKGISKRDRHPRYHSGQQRGCTKLPKISHALAIKATKGEKCFHSGSGLILVLKAFPH